MQVKVSGSQYSATIGYGLCLTITLIDQLLSDIVISVPARLNPFGWRNENLEIRSNRFTPVCRAWHRQAQQTASPILILAGGNDKFVRLTENDKFINEHVFSISHEDFSTKISVNSL